MNARPGLALLAVMWLSALGAPSQAAGQEAPYPAMSSLEAQVEAVGRLAGPSVLNVTTTVLTEDFFNQPVPSQAVGSGFVYDRHGHVVTNFHVVQNANSVSVSLRNGQSYRARVVGEDPSTDLAVLLVDSGALPPPLRLGSSRRVQVGQFVVALGNPFGLSHTLTFGVISALGRIIQSPDGGFIGEAIQTDAPINPGNSGGPLLTLSGEVIGMNSQIVSESGSSSGVGFAIPVDLLKRVVPQLIATGSAEHPWLGIEGIDIQPALTRLLHDAGVDLPQAGGVLVLAVSPGGPAESAGIRGGSQILQTATMRLPVGGDVITGIEGVPMTRMEELSAYIEANASVGQTVRVDVYRNGSAMTIPVTLGARPSGGR